MSTFTADLGSGRDTKVQWIVRTPTGRPLPTPPMSKAQAERLAEVLNEETKAI